MYYQYFGLTEAPFSIAVNPRYLFMSVRHRDALAHLLYGVGAGGGFILLTGEVGTGKTTINRCLLEQLPDNTDIAIILNPALNAMELLASACDELGIVYDVDKHTLKTLTDSLHAYLLDNYDRGRKTVLLIDEAQHLDFDVLEQIRLLTNLETHSEKLLQIILIGQPELAQMLGQPQLRQLNQRITARYNLEPLNLDETGAYIRHRLEVAGMTPGRDVFPASVVRGIYKRTRGIPRLINVLCDRILLGAYGRNKTRADQSMLNLAAREVMGDPAPANAAWRWPAAIAAVLLVAMGVGGWWLLEEYGKQQAVASTAVSPNAAPPEATRLPVQELAPIVSSQPPERIPEPTPEPEPVLEPEAEAAVALAVEPEVVSRWLLPPGESMAQLWALYSEQAVPENPCSDEVQGGVVCIEGQARTWDELTGFDRPLLLDMVTPERFSAAVLLLGLNGRSAWALTDRGVSQVSLAELAPAWTGRYRFLWHPPQGFERPLALGDDSAVVEQVAELFARLDGQLRALADKKFNVALQQRVRLFQLEHKLDDDGVVGVQTLLRLNEQLGIDTTAAGARSQLQDSVSEMVQR
jgi:general secretion pathway protein A